MSEAIRFCKSLYEKYGKKFDGKLVGIPRVIVNEQLQKKQFRDYKFWFDSDGYLFYDLPTIDFSVSTFEKIIEIAKHFEPTMFILFSEYTHPVSNEKGIEFNLKREKIVLLHDRFLIPEIGIGPPQKHFFSIEELADALVKFYVEYGDRKKKTPKLDKTTSVKLT